MSAILPLRFGKSCWNTPLRQIGRHAEEEDQAVRHDLPERLVHPRVVDDALGAVRLFDVPADHVGGLGAVEGDVAGRVEELAAPLQHEALESPLPIVGKVEHVVVDDAVAVLVPGDAAALLDVLVPRVEGLHVDAEPFDDVAAVVEHDRVHVVREGVNTAPAGPQAWARRDQALIETLGLDTIGSTPSDPRSSRAGPRT